MTNEQMNLRTLRVLSRGEFVDWISRSFPRGVSPQWWWAVFEAVETSISPFAPTADADRIVDLQFAASAIPLAVARREIDESMGAYWLLRLAASAVRLRSSIQDLPDMLTPDGSATWALARMPLSRERALAEADIRRHEYSRAEEEYFAPGGVSFKPVAPDPGVVGLQGVERIISALSWVWPHIADESIRQKAGEWLAIKDSL